MVVFFAMRAYKYLKTNHQEDSKRTKIIRLRNIIFKKKDKILDHRRDILVDAELVVLTFEFQKNDERDRRVHMFGTDEGMMCPVIA